ncbi:MAG: hypothetical protein ACREJN_01135 [Nitrospiraceae bacterium]
MDQDDRCFKQGTLWHTLSERTAHPRDRKAILSILTATELIEQSGVTFQVRVITTPVLKAIATAQSNVDPFLAYDHDLFVGEISPTHLTLLNKFNVVDYHPVIVTQLFEPQEALLICLAKIDELGSYNAGPAAEAS